MTFLDCLNSPKCDFTQNRSGGKIIKFQQSQALTSHFESFWSIVKLPKIGQNFYPDSKAIFETNLQSKRKPLFQMGLP